MAQPIEPLIEMLRTSPSIAEQWNCAQALCALSAPRIQADLDACRRDIIQALEAPGSQAPAPFGAAEPITIFKARAAKLDWSTIQMTPEFDLRLHRLGRVVPARRARALRALLRQQAQVVRTLVGPGPHGRR